MNSHAELLLLLLQCIDRLQEWIVDSEMQGFLDKADSFYPAHAQLDFIKEKLQEEHDTSSS